MNKKLNVIEFGKAVLAETMSKHKEVFDGIDKIVEYVKKNHDTTPDMLSKAVVKLSVYLVNLGAIVSEAKSNANEAYTFRKYCEVWQYSKLKDTIKTSKDCEKMSFDNVFEQYRTELINRYVADVLAAYYDDTSRMVMTLQTRLNILRDEMYNSKRGV